MKLKSRKMRNKDKRNTLTNKELQMERTAMCFTEAEKVIGHFKERHKQRMDYKKEKGFKITDNDREDGKMIDNYYKKRDKVRRVRFDEITTATAPLTHFDEDVEVTN